MPQGREDWILLCLVLLMVSGCQIPMHSDHTLPLPEPIRVTRKQTESTRNDSTFILDSAHTPPSFNPPPVVRFQSDSFYGDVPPNRSSFDSSLGYVPPEYAYPFETGTDDRFARFQDSMETFIADSRSDLGYFYSSDNLPIFVGVVGLGAWLANSNLDQNLLEHIQNNSGHEIREFVGEFKFFGEGYVLLPFYLGTAIAGKQIFYDRPGAYRMGEWGERSVRGILLGTPVLLLSQNVLGGSRPGETSHGSQWRFFNDDNGVSGHSFMGAIPFLTAAHMTKDPRVKTTLYALSMLPALSRITDNAHYPSQAIMGWTLAYVATQSVARTELRSEHFDIYPTVSNAGVGLELSIRR